LVYSRHKKLKKEGQEIWSKLVNENKNRQNTKDKVRINLHHKELRHSLGQIQKSNKLVQKEKLKYMNRISIGNINITEIYSPLTFYFIFPALGIQKQTSTLK